MKSRDFTKRQIEIMEAAILRIDTYGIQELTIKNLSADLNLSEAALYRHFKSKNDILLGMLSYFIVEMNERIALILSDTEKHPSELLKQIFDSLLSTFVKKPAIVGVIFSEGIFPFNTGLNEKVSALMTQMQTYIHTVVSRGMEKGIYSSLLGVETTTTIIMGGMRMVVFKWKLSDNKSTLTSEGRTVLNGILHMIEK